MLDWLNTKLVLAVREKDSLFDLSNTQSVRLYVHIFLYLITTSPSQALTLEDLDDIWAAQHGKHEAIVKNVHDLLAKLAWDFSPEQLDHLFGCFQVSCCFEPSHSNKILLVMIQTSVKCKFFPHVFNAKLK